jgi:hypothetical protein
MPRNGSGTMTPDVDFTTEAASPPIEISKLDTALVDISDELTNSIAADGQTNPTANLKMNGFRLTNLGAATALTDAARVSELIDQDHIYYVDSGSANAYVITPSPAIAAYEEGQRFAFRAANASTTASTLNVNGLGAIAIQTADGSALIANSILAGGLYEVTYDANASPDRWVLTSPSSRTPDGMLSSNIPRKDTAATFTADITISHTASPLLTLTDSSTPTSLFAQAANASVAVGALTNHPFSILTNNLERVVVSESGALDFKAGAVTTSNASASEVGYKGTPQNVQNGDYTLVLTDAGKSIDKQSGGAGETITIPANDTVAFPVGTVICGDNDGGGTLTIAITTDVLEDSAGNTGSRTVADNGSWVIKKIAATKWRITGNGVS